MESPSILGSAVTLDGGVGGEAQEAAHAGDEVGHVLVGEGVAEREHGHGVAHLAEGRDGRGADARGRAVGAHQLGKARLDGRIALAQGVVVGVRDLRRVLRRSRARRGGRSRARAARARPSPPPRSACRPACWTRSSPSWRARLPPRAREIQTPMPADVRLPAAAAALAPSPSAAWTARWTTGTSLGTRGDGMSSGDGRPGEGLAARCRLAASSAAPTAGRERLDGVADPGALVDLRAQAAGLQQRVGVAGTTASSGSCARAPRRPSAPR